MYAALSWVPRGVAKEKLPQGTEDDEEMKPGSIGDDQGDEEENSTGNTKDGEQEGEDDAEVDIAQVLANDLDNLSFFKRNEDDPYLTSDPKANQLFDEEELEDLVIRPTDALIVAAKSGDDLSTLEVHLFDDDPDESDPEDGPYAAHFYVHHDIVLPVLPLCTAYTSVSFENANLNLVAVGMFTPGIDIWDVDRVNSLEPVISLGGYQKNKRQSGATAAGAAARSHNKGKKKKKPKLRLVEGSHRDAVMTLSWNNVQKEYLASGSADTTVKIWDVESAHCASTLDHHSSKVQSVAFHPSSAEKLLTGSFDKTVQLVDVRDPSSKISWAVEADVESCQWGSGPTADKAIVSTEDGFISVFDPRMSNPSATNGYLNRWRAHKGAASTFSLSQDIPGLMVSGGVDKFVKVWDISPVCAGNAGELVYERPSKAGALFSVSLCPTAGSGDRVSPFVVAFGGAKGILRVIDLAVESEAVRSRFLCHCPSEVSALVTKRAARSKHQSMPPSHPVQMKSESEDDIDDNDEGATDNSDSGWESE